MSETEPEGLRARSDGDAVLGTDDSARFTTAARALVLGNALASRSALTGLESDIESLGFGRLPTGWGGWSDRVEAITASDDILAEFDLLGEIMDAESSGAIPRGQAAPSRAARLPLWRRVANGGSVAESIAWLRMLMTDTEPLAAAAASAALNGWQPRKTIEVPNPLVNARSRLAAHRASPVAEAREVAVAALPPAGLSYVTRQRPVSGEGPFGLMVHGTGSYIRDWWRPGGDFHSYVSKDICEDLYSDGRPFYWSGTYSTRHRRVAAEDLAAWTQDASGGHLCCVFAHSYGGVVALMATTMGVGIDNLVLLSAPVENVPVEWRNVGRAMSLRIHLDLVLLAARRRQKFTENVEEHWLPYWFRDHGFSHSPEIWDQHECKSTLNL